MTPSQGVKFYGYKCRTKSPAYGKVCQVCNKNDYVIIETINIQKSLHINQIKNENSDWSIILPSNKLPFSYKIDTGYQCNVFFLKALENLDPEPDLSSVSIKLSTYDNSNSVH